MRCSNDKNAKLQQLPRGACCLAASRPQAKPEDVSWLPLQGPLTLHFACIKRRPVFAKPIDICILSAFGNTRLNRKYSAFYTMKCNFFAIWDMCPKWRNNGGMDGQVQPEMQGEWAGNFQTRHETHAYGQNPASQRKLPPARTLAPWIPNLTFYMGLLLRNGGTSP